LFDDKSCSDCHALGEAILQYLLRENRDNKETSK